MSRRRRRSNRDGPGTSFGLLIYQFTLPELPTRSPCGRGINAGAPGLGVALIVAVRTWRAHTLRNAHADLRRGHLGSHHAESVGSGVVTVAVSTSRHRANSAASATSAIASARSVRPPSVMSRPIVAAACTSSARPPAFGSDDHAGLPGGRHLRLAKRQPGGGARLDQHEHGRRESHVVLWPRSASAPESGERRRGRIAWPTTPRCAPSARAAGRVPAWPPTTPCAR